jgi:hypothetical protein
LGSVPEHENMSFIILKVLQLGFDTCEDSNLASKSYSYFYTENICLFVVL